MAPVELVLWSDYLCPWCYNAAVRMRQLEAEFGDALCVSWRSYLLRPAPRPRSLERFRAYTRSWERPGGEPDGGRFRTWQGDAGPPSHSLPPQLVAKAAAAISPDAFRLVHARLWPAYFAESRDITDTQTLRSLWREAGLPEAEFARREDPELHEQVLREHQQAIEAGATGVPAAALAGIDAAVVGAHPLELYRRWVRRALERS